MPARDYSTPQRPHAAHNLIDPSASRISSRRRMRIQAQTDLYAALESDSNPKHPLLHCTAVYELEDRSKPSISSF